MEDWKQATAQINYHISIEKKRYTQCYMNAKKVDVRIMEHTIEFFYNHNHIASHRHFTGRSGNTTPLRSI
ncbi:Mu transposase domain-containing protein [Eisenbergiella porci]|uniref:Mu transposase domain-containing protein n=1 Tax=Eisenbergiella TaxID=1432051 RepID=UPI0038BDDB79